MNPLLLLGAGFSCNWGGWLASEAFEYLLGDPDVIARRELRDLLWKHQPVGGFEAALGELQRGAAQNRSNAHLVHVLESAIRRMFDSMNAAYSGRGIEFHKPIGFENPVRSFLRRFKAIFTLNQDLLLEHGYLANKEMQLDAYAITDWQLPGMRLLADERGRPRNPSAVGTWVPTGDHVVAPDEQPVFKLHGSSNWRTSDEQSMLILGGGKQHAISQFPVLKWYEIEFARRLSEADTRLMVIGYSFRDEHINAVLRTAIAQGLKLFVIDPNGSDVAKTINPTARAGAIYARTPLEDDVQAALIGASRRALSSTFSHDTAEHRKVMRFFDS